MKEKIGVGIITCNRPDMLRVCYDSLPKNKIDKLVIVNDGDPLVEKYYCDIIQHDKNQGVAVSKNDAFKFLLEKQDRGIACDHIFLIEDDIFIKDNVVFEKYIHASRMSGIQHFNFSQHGVMNKKGYNNSGAPNPRLVVQYNKYLQIPLFQHCVGAFSYYTKKCLDECGIIDESYYNACEHVDHTYSIIKKGMHPPFWYFADIDNSNKYIGDKPWTRESSTISSRPDHDKLVRNADVIFLSKHKTVPGGIPDTSEAELQKQLIEIQKKYGSNTSNV